MASWLRNYKYRFFYWFPKHMLISDMLLLKCLRNTNQLFSIGFVGNKLV